MKTVADRKAELLGRQAYLMGRLSGIESEFDTHQAKDFEDMATEREGDEVLADLGQAGRNELRMIEAALRRVDEGEYGYCVVCGNEIAAERLDVLPATPFCAKHADNH